MIPFILNPTSGKIVFFCTAAQLRVGTPNEPSAYFCKGQQLSSTKKGALNYLYYDLSRTFAKYSEFKRNSIFGDTVFSSTLDHLKLAHSISLVLNFGQNLDYIQKRYHEYASAVQCQSSVRAVLEAAKSQNLKTFFLFPSLLRKLHKKVVCRGNINIFSQSFYSVLFTEK